MEEGGDDKQTQHWNEEAVTQKHSKDQAGIGFIMNVPFGGSLVQV